MDDNVKQRLVGAVVLASIAVIFFPSLFDEPDNRYIGGQSQIPPTPTITPQVIADPVRPDAIEPAKAPDQMYALVDEPEAPVEAPAPAPKEAPNASALEAPAVAPGLNEQGVLRGWVLQVASFTEKSRADDLRERLEAAGHSAFVRPLVNSKGQQVVRVFVGPKADKATILALKKELDASLKVNSLVKEFKP
ncbi:SPOR domain-containing protein [Simiduia aestuariiviva]|uniref:DedD protein n=1 Tax=Simiduia aestuariiviva TaxID=1510459 RepID=A0A839UJR2_9GAMM|nr:DedD protein [Simiduia aestuariiviva]